MTNYTKNPVQSQVKCLYSPTLELPGLLIPHHKIHDKDSKSKAWDTLYGWQRVELTADKWLSHLERGRTIILADMMLNENGKYSHGKDYWHGTHFIFADADNIAGVEFLEDGTDKNSTGVPAFTERGGLSKLFPTLSEHVFAVTESVNSMLKLPHHRRYRLAFCFDELIETADDYNAILAILGEDYPIIAAASRSPAQPVFGNARPNGKVHRVGNVLSTEKYLSRLEASEHIAQQNSSHGSQFNVDIDLDAEGDLIEFLKRNEIRFTQNPSRTGMFWVKCPYTRFHTGGRCGKKDAYVFVNENGKFAFHCSHTSCKSAGRTTWAMFKKGYDIKGKVVRASDKSTIDPNFKPDTITIEEARKQNHERLLNAVMERSSKRGKHLIVWNSPAGTGKTQNSLKIIETGSFMYPTTELTDMAHETALKAEVERIKNASYENEDDRAVDLEFADKQVFRHRARMRNYKEEGWADMALGLGDDERPCINPVMCNKYAERGLPPQIVCSTCPVVQACKERAYLSQDELIKNASQVFMARNEELVVDRRFQHQLSRFTEGKGNCWVVLEEAKAGQMSQRRSISRKQIIDLMNASKVAVPAGADEDVLIGIRIKMLREFEYAVCMTHDIEMRFKLIKTAIIEAVDALYDAGITIPKSVDEKKRESKLNRNLDRIEDTKVERLLYCDLIAEGLASRAAGESDPEVIKRIIEEGEWEFGIDDEEMQVSLSKALRILYQIKRRAVKVLGEDAGFDVEEEKKRVQAWATELTEKHQDKYDEECLDAMNTDKVMACVELLDDDIERIPAYIKYNRDVDGNMSATIRTAHTESECQIVGENDGCTEPHLVREDVKADDVIAGRWIYQSLSYRMAIQAGVMDAGDPLHCYHDVVGDLWEFIETHPNIDNAPCWYNDNEKTLELHYELIPTLNHNRVLMITASDASEHIGQAFAGTDVDVKYVSCDLPEFKQGCHIFQCTTGKYSSKTALVEAKAGEPVTEKERLRMMYNHVIKPLLDAPVKILVVAEKVVGESDIGKKLKEAGVLLNHTQAEGLNTYEDADVVIVFHPEPNGDAVIAKAKRVFRNADLSFGRGEIEIKAGGVTYRGMGYIDERVQSVYESECGMRIMQSMMRLRPNINEHKVMIVFSAMPIPMMPQSTIQFRPDDLDWLERLIMHDPVTAFMQWGCRDERVVEMHRKGMAADDIAEDVGLSERHVYRLIERWNEQNSIRVTGHGESDPQPFSDIPLQYIHCSEMSLKAPPLPETSDNGTGHGESDPQTNGRGHKNVAGMLIHLLSDGIERRTSEIVAEIDASERNVKIALKKLEKTGEIIKVRHGVYAIAPPEAEPHNEDATMIVKNVAPQSEWDAALKKMLEGASEATPPVGTADTSDTPLSPTDNASNGTLPLKRIEHESATDDVSMNGHARSDIELETAAQEDGDSGEAEDSPEGQVSVWLVPCGEGLAYLPMCEDKNDLSDSLIINIEKDLPSLASDPTSPGWVVVDASDLRAIGVDVRRERITNVAASRDRRQKTDVKEPERVFITPLGSGMASEGHGSFLKCRYKNLSKSGALAAVDLRWSLCRQCVCKRTCRRGSVY